MRRPVPAKPIIGRATLSARPKLVKGRKRDIAIEKLRLPLAILVTSANTLDEVRGGRVVERWARWLKHKGPKRIETLLKQCWVSGSRKGL